jgi:CO/xanthine dehydrogenase Mo-binding subunit
VGTSVAPLEASRLVRGEGRFVDDIELPGLLHGHFVRSPHPHARIQALETSAARSAPGVAAIYVRDDLGPLGAPVPMLFDDPGIARARSHVPLADGVVRYVGEPIAFIVAASRAAAEDAAELLRVEYQVRAAVGDVSGALATGAPLVHDDVPGNVAGTRSFARGDASEAMSKATHRLRFEVRMDRGASVPMETRGVTAAPEVGGGGIRVWASTQRPVKLRDGLADMLGLRPDQVRVLATDVGGGFGPKGMYLYPEEIVVTWASIQLGKPVRWIEDRLEHFGATSQLREQVHSVEVGVEDDGTVVALRDHFVHDGGAYVPYGLSVPMYTAVTLAGPYRIPAVEATYDVVYTNRTPTCPYRGSGGPYATFVVERCMDRVGAELGVDRLEVRRRNLIREDEMPFDSGIAFADGRPSIHDGTPYRVLLDQVAAAMDTLDGAASRVSAAGPRHSRRLLGRAIALYTEATGVRSFEGARVSVSASGAVTISVGTSSQGQGHETTLAQICADSLGVGIDAVTVVQGDTGAFGWGRGTYGSKVAVVVGNAVAMAAAAVRDRALAEVATASGSDVDELTIVGGEVQSRSGTTLASLGEVAARSRYAAGGPMAPASSPGLDATSFYSPERSSIAGGAHGVELEVDPDTGTTTIQRYVVASDSGVVINPEIVDGQLRGAVAQGIGGALLEELAWSDPGVLANGNMMEYLIPRIGDVPDIELIHVDTPSVTNPLGAKGAGEAGIFGVSAAIVAALEDALACESSDPIMVSPVSPTMIRQRAARLGTAAATRPLAAGVMRA